MSPLNIHQNRELYNLNSSLLLAPDDNKRNLFLNGQTFFQRIMPLDS